MICAYDKVYLEKARVSLARMLDFAVHDLNFNLTYFFELFIRSGIADLFEHGDYAVTVGVSGIELAYKVLEASGIQREHISPGFYPDRSAEYWAGWALSYYQWKKALSFAEIIKYVPIKDIVNLYEPYHEMDIRQFCDKMNELYIDSQPNARLKFFRKRSGLSQRELAERSGVPIRTIQQYEQRQKNINKAQAEYLIMLAKVLCCKAEDLIERMN